MQKKRSILTGELVTNKVLGVEMHNCLKPEEKKKVLQLMLLSDNEPGLSHLGLVGVH